MRSALLAFLLLLSLHAARGEPLWQTLPPTPAPVPGEHIGHAKVNGISITRRSVTVRRSSSCTVVSPTRTIGAIRSRLSLPATPSSSWTAAATAAARATPARSATISWPTTSLAVQSTRIEGRFRDTGAAWERASVAARTQARRLDRTFFRARGTRCGQCNNSKQEAERRPACEPGGICNVSGAR